jgi:hypothetical protein
VFRAQEKDVRPNKKVPLGELGGSGLISATGGDGSEDVLPHDHSIEWIRIKALALMRVARAAVCTIYMPLPLFIKSQRTGSTLHDSSSPALVNKGTDKLKLVNKGTDKLKH